MQLVQFQFNQMCFLLIRCFYFWDVFHVAAKIDKISIDYGLEVEESVE